MHSWRVLILPYMEAQHIYDQYRFDEPWDGPSNGKLHSPMPDCYRCPNHDRNWSSGKTSYVAVVGSGAAWLGAERRKVTEIADGADSTILVLEGPPLLVDWMAPEDLTIWEAQRLLTSPPAHGDGAHVDDSGFITTVNYGRAAAFADGAVFGLPQDSPPEIASALLYISDGRPAPDPWTHFRRSQNIATKWSNAFRLTLLLLLILLPIPWTLHQSAVAAATLGRLKPPDRSSWSIGRDLP